jgi:hypothetical protein
MRAPRIPDPDPEDYYEINRRKLVDGWDGIMAKAEQDIIKTGNAMARANASQGLGQFVRREVAV